MEKKKKELEQGKVEDARDFLIKSGVCDRGSEARVGCRACSSGPSFRGKVTDAEKRGSVATANTAGKGRAWQWLRALGNTVKVSNAMRCLIHMMNLFFSVLGESQC